MWVSLDYLMLCERTLDQNAEEVQTNFWNKLPSGHLYPMMCPEAAGWGASPAWDSLVAKGLAQSGHRDGYSPTGRSSGSFTAVMLGRNVGATLAATVGTTGRWKNSTPL